MNKKAPDFSGAFFIPISTLHGRASLRVLRCRSEPGDPRLSIFLMALRALDGRLKAAHGELV
jgi:hypothetical protein